MRLLLLLLLATAAAAQPINLVNGPRSACISSIAPSPPERLRATPGNGSVTLTWDRPANGACVQEYDVSRRAAVGGGGSDAPQRLPMPSIMRVERPTASHVRTDFCRGSECQHPLLLVAKADSPVQRNDRRTDERSDLQIPSDGACVWGLRDCPLSPLPTQTLTTPTQTAPVLGRRPCRQCKRHDPSHALDLRPQIRLPAVLPRSRRRLYPAELRSAGR